MTSFSRTQLPRRSVEKHASHSWLTWAPESARPTSTPSRCSSQAIASGSLLASTDRKRVSRSSSSEMSSITSSGGAPPFLGDVGDLSVDQLGMRRALGDLERAPSSA